MHAGLRILPLVALAISTTEARPNTCTAQPQSSGAHCILRQGREYAAAYCSSILSLSASPFPTKTRTVTENVTETTKLITATGTPPITSMVFKTKTVNTTEVFTETRTILTGTTTSYVDTSTVTSTSFSIVYTCNTVNTTRTPSASSSGNTTTSRTGHHSPIGSVSSGVTGSYPSASISISSSPGSNLSVTAHRPPPITSYAPPCSYEPKKKRQSPIFSSPYCLKKFSRKYGDAAITDACECLDIKTPAPLSTITSTSTIKITGTTTITPTVTTRRLTTVPNFINSTTTTIENTVKAINATSTLTLTVTSRITTASPTPSQFYIYYSEFSSNNTNLPAHFFSADTSPGGSGIVLAPEAAADSFSLDSSNRLVDTTDGNQIIAKNTDDLYPFELLRTKAATKNTPICSACDGALQCDYPGTTGNTFALCYGYLALGPKSVFGKDSDANGDVDCIPIKLQFK